MKMEIRKTYLVNKIIALIPQDMINGHFLLENMPLHVLLREYRSSIRSCIQ